MRVGGGEQKSILCDGQKEASQSPLTMQTCALMKGTSKEDREDPDIPTEIIFCALKTGHRAFILSMNLKCLFNKV